MSQQSVLCPGNCREGLTTSFKIYSRQLTGVLPEHLREIRLTLMTLPFTDLYVTGIGNILCLCAICKSVMSRMGALEDCPQPRGQLDD